MNKKPISGKQEDRDKLASTRKTENSARSSGYFMEQPFSHSYAHFGNTTLQRLLAERAGDAPFGMDDATAGRIHRARSDGQVLDGAVQVSRVGPLTQTPPGNKHLTIDIEGPFSKLKDAVLNHGSTL